MSTLVTVGAEESRFRPAICSQPPSASQSSESPIAEVTPIPLSVAARSLMFRVPQLRSVRSGPGMRNRISRRSSSTTASAVSMVSTLESARVTFTVMPVPSNTTLARSAVTPLESTLVDCVTLPKRGRARAAPAMLSRFFAGSAARSRLTSAWVGVRAGACAAGSGTGAGA